MLPHNLLWPYCGLCRKGKLIFKSNVQNDLQNTGIDSYKALTIWFFFSYFIFYYYYFLTLQYCIGFAIHQHESATGVHVFPILNPPSHLPPHFLGHPSAPAPSILYFASNLDWRFISYMLLYMFQCHSPKSSHPLPLPQSPTDCSIQCTNAYMWTIERW